MGKLAEKKAMITKRISAVRSEKVLDAVTELLEGGSAVVFTTAQVMEFEAIAERYGRGIEKGTAWNEVEKKMKRQAGR